MDARDRRHERRDEAARRAAARTAAGRDAKHLQRWRRFRRRLGAFALELCAPFVLRLLAASWRVQRTGDRGLELLASERPWIIAMWHGRMLCLMPLRRHKGRGIHVLVSPSDDGSLAAKALHSFRYRIVRGSLSRGGASALRTMRDLMAGGGQLVVTPDGPRGPRHAMNVGTAWLARASGSPVLPIGVAVDRAWRLRSWDRFTIPKPFARLVVSYGEPLHVAAGATDEALEEIATELRARTIALERDGFARLGIIEDFEA